MVKRYAFLWHVIVSEDAAASKCEGAETEAPTQPEAYKKLSAWMEKRVAACGMNDCACKDGWIFTSEITTKMVMSGMTEHMVKI